VAIFVLIHGAFHGAWCWVKLRPELERRGHRVRTPDMPGCGQDRTPLAEVTLALCADRIGAALEGAGEPVVLVGHSMGATLASQAAARRPELVRRMVFLAGVIPMHGLSLYSLLHQMDDPQGPPRPEPPPGDPWLDLAQPPPSFERAQVVYYNDCASEDIAYAVPLLRAQANAPRRTKLDLPPHFYDLPRAFIGCAQDRANTPVRQQATLAMFPCRRQLSLPTGHSPFFSNPALLAEMLASLA